MSMDQANLWATVTTGAGKDAFRLRELWGEERQSGLFRFDLELESDDDAVDFSKSANRLRRAWTFLMEGSGTSME